jgi:RNA polymerase sigma factor (sigma-70 family)
MATPSMRELSLDAVAAGCRDEARRSRRDELGYCFELFRRALDEGSQSAWQALAAQYERLIFDWIHAARLPDPAEVEDAAREALERFWRTLANRSEPVATSFAHTGALLKYLHQCAVTTVLDRRRREQRRARLDARIQAYEGLAPVSSELEASVLERVERGEQVARVRAWVAAVSDQGERRVIQLSFVDGLSPAEIAARFPAEFADAQSVRQIKERVLRRARRALLEGDSGAGP